MKKGVCFARDWQASIFLGQQSHLFYPLLDYSWLQILGEVPTVWIPSLSWEHAAVPYRYIYQQTFAMWAITGAWMYNVDIQYFCHYLFKISHCLVSDYISHPFKRCSNVSIRYCPFPSKVSGHNNKSKFMVHTSSFSFLIKTLIILFPKTISSPLLTSRV